MINQSWWPTLLDTDAGSGRKVAKRVEWLSYLSTFAAILLGVAAALTPLGLSTTTHLGSDQEIPFTYVKDLSPIGRGTPSRGLYKANRFCGFQYPVNCPGTFEGYNFTVVTYPNGTENVDRRVAPGYKHPYLSTSVAPNITEAFTAATRNSTIACTYTEATRSM